MAAPAVAAEATGAHLTGIELSTPVRQSMAHIQEGWLRWMSAFFQDHEAEADQQLEYLESNLRELGFTRLPDLSLGAVARSVEAARQGRFERARRGLRAAEKLDEGRPETAFARSLLAWHEGSYAVAVIEHLLGYVRLFDVAGYRFLWLSNLGVWLLATLLVAGAAFVLLLAATKGPTFYRELVTVAERHLPEPFAHLLAVAVVFWPLLVPGSVFWLLCYWSVLLWSYVATSEKVVTVAVWLLVAATPLLVAEQQRHLIVELSPPGQAMDALSEGRLYGSLFTDLGALRTVLPDHPAVWQLIADVHRRMGQWDQARTLYRQILETEPDNVPVLVDLGAYYFRKADYGNAVEYFQRATRADSQSAAAYYNLSQAFSESYLFEDQQQTLSRARRIDNERVAGWIQRPPADRVVTVDGGGRRMPELRGLLVEAFSPRQGSQALKLAQRSGISLAFPIVALAAALAFAWVRSKVSPKVRRPGMVPVGGGPVFRWLSLAIPGLGSADLGNGGRTFGALAVVLGLVLLPLAGVLGYRIPWGLSPGSAASVVAAVAGLALFFGLRILLEVREGS